MVTAGLLNSFLLAASSLVQPLDAQNAPPHVWTADRPDARAPISITEDRIIPAGVLQFGVRYLYADNSGQGYGTDSLTITQVLSLFDVAPSEMVTQGFAVDVLWGITDRITMSATALAESPCIRVTTHNSTMSR